MRVGGKEVKAIQVITDDGGLIACITDEDVIGKSGYKVECVPCDNPQGYPIEK